jgi:hypothetical protein
MSALHSSPVTAPFKVDVTRGMLNGRVSSEWFNRPADQRFLSLDSLYDYVDGLAEHSTCSTVASREIRVEASRDNPELLDLILPKADAPASLTAWSFGQIASIAQAPAGYLRSLPGSIAGINLQYGLSRHRGELVKVLVTNGDRAELRAFTGPDYGRIWDRELVAAVRKIAGDGTGDTRWKVPGMLDWSTGTHNPYVDVTTETTTLYASDRDVFLFLVDDTNPIEAGKLPDGSPDWYFRGFYAWNSEVGSKTLGIATFYLRGVCQNRNLWGVEEFRELKIRHSKFAANRFAFEARPALERFANSGTAGFVAGIKSAKDRIVASDADERESFLRRQGFSRPEAASIIETVIREEGRPPESVFDFVQGITAFARGKQHQDARLDLEKSAGALLAKVAA